MAEEAQQNKLTQALFAFYVWQSDLVREITPKEAEIFFAFLENTEQKNIDAALRIELLQTYPKLWREYVKLGPPLPLELSLLTHTFDENLRAGLLQLLSALGRAAPGNKRRQALALNRALIKLINRDDSALGELQRFFQSSRFFETRLKKEAAVSPVSAIAPEKPAAAVPVAEAVNPEKTVAQGNLTTKVFEAAPSNISILKLVPWSEHDAVNPEKLQFWTKGARAMRCIAIIDRTHDFKSFQFMAEEPTLFFYKPGQFITIELNIDGKRALRSYTISSSPSRPHLIEISVKRLKNGLVSNYLHNELNIGDTVMMKPPGGKFHCFDTRSEKFLFLAAGSGITPMLSMARWWHDTGAQPDVIFFHSIREPEDAVFTEDMITFTSANRKFQYVSSFTSPKIPENWPGMKGRLNEDKLKLIAPDFNERMVFTCGPDSFMRNVKLILERNSYSFKENYRQESFGTQQTLKEEMPAIPVADRKILTEAKPAIVPLRPVKPAANGAAPTVVHFSLSALEVFGGDMDIPILDLAEEAGVDLSSSCRSGTCGTCRAIKIRGEIECDDSPGLTDADREAGYILTCVSRAKNYVEIEV